MMTDDEVRELVGPNQMAAASFSLGRDEAKVIHSAKAGSQMVLSNLAVRIDQHVNG